MESFVYICTTNRPRGGLALTLGRLRLVFYHYLHTECSTAFRGVPWNGA